MDLPHSPKKNNRRVLVLLRKIIRTKIFVYFLCLCVSFGIWNSISLSQLNTKTLSYNIQLINHPDHYTLVNQPPSQLFLTIEASGYDLQSLHQKNNAILDLDVSRFSLQKDDEQFSSILLHPMHLESEIFSQLMSKGNIKDITPDTILLVYAKNSTKEVPISLNINYQLMPQYWLSQEPIITPKAIVIEGLPQDVDSIASITTRFQDFQYISDTIRTTLYLETPTTKHSISLSVDSVQLTIPVEQYTEKTFQIPIQATSSKTRYKLKTFPNTVTVSCLVSLNHFNQICDSMFEAQVFYNDDLNKDAPMLPVQIINHSTDAKVSKTIPEKVEYILIKQ